MFEDLEPQKIIKKVLQEINGAFNIGGKPKDDVMGTDTLLTAPIVKELQTPGIIMPMEKTPQVPTLDNLPDPLPTKKDKQPPADKKDLPAAPPKKQPQR